MTSDRAAVAVRSLPLVLALALAAVPAAAEPLTGRYQARPSPVLGCGGLSGVCRVFQLEGWVEVETFGIVFPGTLPAVRFLASDLRLRAVGDDTTIPFPAPGDLQLAQLEVVGGAQHIVEFANPPGSPQTVELDLFGVEDPEQSGEPRFLLSGFYSEGCCDRFDYEIGGVLFDWTGPLLQTPALRLDHGFRVTVTWRDGRGGSGVGTPIALDGASGRFWFFQPDNPEIFVKVIDACEPFGRFWFFAAGLTDVEVEIRVDGPALFEPEKVYTSPAGMPFAPIQDTEGFSCGGEVV